jgi:DNA-binding transcriptional MerR regulator
MKLIMKLYSIRDLSEKLGRSNRTIVSWLNKFKLKPVETGDNQKNLYDRQQFNLLENYRDHLAGGGTIAGFVVESAIEIVESSQKLEIERATVDHPNQIFDRVFYDCCAADPFFDLESLQRIAQNGWLLPTKRIATIINLSPATLIKLSSYLYQGFLIRRETRSGAGILWRVESNNS